MFEGLNLYPDYYGPDSSETALYTTPRRDLEDLNFRLKQACTTARFAGANISSSLDDESTTHLIVGNDKSRLRYLRERIPRSVSNPFLSSRFNADALAAGNASPVS